MRHRTAIGDTVFGRFRIQSLIGEGGQGFVWKGVDLVRSVPIAVKELTSDSPELRKRFEREMELTLDHPTIVCVHQCGEESGNYYFAMEYLDGESLSTVLERRGRLPEGEAVLIVRQVAQGLACAHAHCIIHRDIKPENIMILRDGRVKITDFGIACFLDKERVTRMGATMGTAHYMSPEQVEDVSKVDCTSDMFSLGVVFYEMLTGKKPFNAEMLGELYVAIITATPIKPREIVPSLTASVEALVMKMLAKRPEDRFPTMDEFLTALSGGGQAPPSGKEVQNEKADARIGQHELATPASRLPGERRKERTGVPCPACRIVNQLGSSFCAQCGFDLRARCVHCQGSVTTGALFCPCCGHPVAEPTETGCLLGLKGGFAGERLPIDRDFVTMGRHSSNDICFAGDRDEYVSRFQARIYRERGCVWIEGWDWVKNGATTNGTFVNGRNVDGKGRVPIKPGDRIRIGDSFFRYEVSPEQMDSGTMKVVPRTGR